MDFSEFRDNCFNGDEERAVAQVAYEMFTEDYALSGGKENLLAITNSMDKETAGKCMEFLQKELRKQAVMEETETLLRKLDMTAEDAAKAEKNPFVKKFWISIAKIFAGIIVMAVLVWVKRRSGFESQLYDSLVSYGVTIFIGLCAVNSSKALMNVFGFRKVRRYIAELSDDFAEGENKVPVVSEGISGGGEAHTELKEITRGYCLTELQSCFVDRKNMYLVLAVILALLFRVCSLVSLFWVVPTIISPIVCIVLHVKNKKRLRRVKKLDFYISTATCSGKDYKKSKDDGTISNRKIYFSNKPPYKINFSQKGVFLQEKLEAHLYDSINEGDLCYVIHMGNEEKISAVFPAKEYIIAEGEFVDQDGRLVPVKDKDAASIMSDAIAAETGSMSSTQKKYIDEAEAAIEKAGKRRKNCGFLLQAQLFWHCSK